MSAVVESHGDDAAERAEKRWAWVVAGIIFLLVATMVWTGVHWAAMPPSRVEVIDPRTVSPLDVDTIVGAATDLLI